MSISRFILLLTSFLVFSGCEQPFDPKGSYTEDIVAYVILSDAADAQYARIYRTYNPPGFDPFESTTDHQVAGAQVAVTADQTVFAFRDTLVVRKDTTRYPSPINAYVASPFRAVKGKIYSLAIMTPDSVSIGSKIRLPEAGQIVVSNMSALHSPTVTTHSSVAMAVYISTLAKGYILRFNLWFESFEGGVWVPRFREVPLAIVERVGGEEVRYFPTLTRSLEGSTSHTLASQYFDISAYKTIIGEILRDFGGSVRFTSAVFILTQVEPNLYNYYGIANGFRDPNSIRVDEPDFTNINGGIGVFGGLVHDTLVVALPSTL